MNKCFSENANEYEGIGVGGWEFSALDF